MKYNENPTQENSSKFLIELAKLGIVWSNNTEEEKEAAKDWADLSFKLFVSKDYDKTRALLAKQMSDIDQLSVKATRDVSFAHLSPYIGLSLSGHI